MSGTCIDNGDEAAKRKSLGALSALVDSKPSWATASLVEITTLLGSESVMSSPGTQRVRLMCVLRLMRLPNASSEAVEKCRAAFLGEAVLAVKSSNQKTRIAAFKVLDAMAEQATVPLVHGIASGLASTLDHMKSASVTSLSRVLWNYGRTPEMEALLPRLCETILLFPFSGELASSLVTFSSRHHQA